MAIVGLLQGKKLILTTAVGPATAISVDAGGYANVDLKVAFAEAATHLDITGLKSIMGLPDGITIQSITYPTLETARVRVRNCSTATIFIPVNSVTVELQVLGL